MNLLKKINDKKILYFISLCILTLIPFLKILSYYLSSYKVISNYDNINPAYVLYISIPFLIYLYIKNLIKTKRKFNIYDYLFYILVFTGLISSIFAIDIKIAFLGKEYRHEGFLSVLSYYLLFINWKQYGDKKYIKNILNIFIIIALINSIYALFQIYYPFKYILRYGYDTLMASGICGNPNFFGSLIVTVLSIVTARYLIDRKMSIKQIILIILFFISIINSQSTGPFLTYLITLLFLIIYLSLKKLTYIKNIICLIIILVITYFSIVFLNKQILQYYTCEMCEFTNTVINNNSDVSTSHKITNGRTSIWKDSLKIVKENWFDGVGYDNFNLAYYKGVNLGEVRFVSVDGQIKAEKVYSQIVDNAHNVYLHNLVTTGVIGVIPYLLLCLLVFIQGIKIKDNIVIPLLGGFVAYSIQAFGNISVIQIAPIYYILMGLILSVKS